MLCYGIITETKCVRTVIFFPKRMEYDEETFHGMLYYSAMVRAKAMEWRQSL